MKVYIGPFVRWVGPYQIADWIMCDLLRWVTFGKIKYDKHEDDVVHEFGKWLATDKHGDDSYLSRVCQWIHEKQKRKVKVRIDPYDTWNLDSTLAYIILPALKQLKEDQHGFPLVDDSDVPEGLGIRSTDAPEHSEYTWDDNAEKRWAWVLGEMIWAFEQIHPDSHWEKALLDKPFDLEEYRSISGRVQRGLSLFGEYFLALWE